MFDILEQLAADGCEVWVFRSDQWNVQIKTKRDGIALEVKEFSPYGKNESLEDVFNRALAKFRRVTGAAPELLPPRLAPPAQTEFTPFIMIDKEEIPF